MSINRKSKKISSLFISVTPTEKILYKPEKKTFLKKNAEPQIGDVEDVQKLPLHSFQYFSTPSESQKTECETFIHFGNKIGHRLTYDTFSESLKLAEEVKIGYEKQQHDINPVTGCQRFKIIPTDDDKLVIVVSKYPVEGRIMGVTVISG